MNDSLFSILCYNMHNEIGDFMLKMSLNEIRWQIQIYLEHWVHLYTTNCYALRLNKRMM